MPKVLRPALAAVLLVPLACAERRDSAPDEAAGERGALVATFEGQAIHQRDLDDWIRDDLFDQATRDKDEAALFEFRSDALRRMLTARLLEAEATQRGIGIDELHRQTVASASVSDEEVASFYETNRSRMGGASLEEIGPQIRGFLEQQEQSQVWADFQAGLVEGADLTIAMSPPRLDVEAVGPALGPEGAPVTIVEFSDFNCPYCQRVNPTLKELRERYPEQVRIVFRHFPLDRLHPRARPIAEAAVCADAQGAFWPFHDRVFEDGAPLADPEIADAARELGLDMTAFEACLADEATAAAVQRDIDAGVAAGVTGTPAFFVNGIKLSGAQPLAAFANVIESELARAAAAGEATPAS